MKVTDAAAVQKFIETYRDNPLAFAQNCYSWGEGRLAGMQLEKWQIEALSYMRDCITKQWPILICLPGGHGTGKSAFFSIVLSWAATCLHNVKGQITANKEDQLRTKTWPEVRKWYDLCPAAQALADIGSTKLYNKFVDSWGIDWAVWSKANMAGYSGLHRQGYATLQILDEADQIPDEIWDAAMGALSNANTQHIILTAANPATLGTRFHKIGTQMAGSGYGQWKVINLNAEDISFSDKQHLANMAEQWGVDSDVYNVRVRGRWPKSSLCGFFDMDSVRAAVGREFTKQSDAVPMTWGLDVAYKGADATCLVMRHGCNVPRIERYHGMEGDALASTIAAEYTRADHKPHAIFIDCSGGWGNEVYGFLKYMVPSSILRRVNFANKSNDPQYYNLKAKMYGGVKDWFRNGACVVRDDQLIRDCENIECAVDVGGRGILISSKELLKSRGLPSPDALDALACTFAEPVTTAQFDLRRQNTLQTMQPSFTDFNFLEVL